MRTSATFSAAGVRTVTAIGALLFAGSISWFLYQYAVIFGRVAGGASWAGPLTWNVVLFTAFALHHSLFARTPIRAAIARHVPAPLERSLYVWIASALFVAVCTFWRPVPGVAWDVSGPGRWLLSGLQVAGLVLTLRGAAVLDVRELAGLAPQRMATSDARQPAFKTTWPYGWVRHPIYAGWFLMLLTATPMTMTRLTFAAISCAYLLLAIPLEEGTLRRTSGEAYRQYERQVPWRLLPGFY